MAAARRRSINASRHFLTTRRDELRSKVSPAQAVSIDGDAMLLPGRARPDRHLRRPQAVDGCKGEDWGSRLQPGRGLEVLAAWPPAFALRIMPGKEITISLWPPSHPHFRLVNASE